MKSEQSIKDELLYSIKDIRRDFNNWTWEQRNYHIGYACALAETVGRYSLCDLLNDKVEGEE
jgi:hypothetical protein|tara:strand:+ start:1872 stop:2057 length:186 start_codon:yes stop_codon:yes gene_type:complete